MHAHTHTLTHTHTRTPYANDFWQDLQETGKQMFTKKRTGGVGGKPRATDTLSYLDFELYMLPNFKFFNLNF